MHVDNGPYVAYGSRNPVGYGASSGGTNDNFGPSALLGGNGMLDPRYGYNVTKKGFAGMGVQDWRVLSVAPAAITVGGIAPAANVSSGVAMTLATAATGIAVLAAALTVIPGTLNTGVQVPAGSLVLDSTPALVNYGLADKNGNYINNAYDISTLLGRAVAINGATSGTGGDFLVSGYDCYGYAMSETITATAGDTTVNGKKAFKFITSVVPQFTDAHNYSVDTTDIFGFPIRADRFSQTLVHWDDTLITANTGFVAADTTSPATATTGDVRGTYAVQSASDGTKRLTFRVGPGQSNLMTPTGLFGVAQA